MSNLYLAENLSFYPALIDSISSTPAPEGSLLEANLLTRDRYKTCRIVPVDNQATITCTLAADQEIGAVGLFGMNLTVTAEGRCRLLDDGNEVLWNSDFQTLYPSGAGYHLAQSNRGYVWWAPSNYPEVRVVEITLQDTAAYFDLSRLAFGPVWSPEINPSYDGHTWKPINTAEYFRTKGGTGRAVPADYYRQVRLFFRFLSESERNQMSYFISQAGQSLLLSLFPGHEGQVEMDYQMLCELSDIQELIPTAAGIWQTTIVVEEI